MGKYVLLSGVQLIDLLHKLIQINIHVNNYKFTHYYDIIPKFRH